MTDQTPIERLIESVNRWRPPEQGGANLIADCAWEALPDLIRLSNLDRAIAAAQPTDGPVWLAEKAELLDERDRLLDSIRQALTYLNDSDHTSAISVLIKAAING